MNGDRDEQVRQRAHKIWQREGEQHGSHDRHWEQANSEIDAEASGAGSSTAAAHAPDGGDASSVTGAGPALAKHSKDAVEKPKSAAADKAPKSDPSI